MIGKTGKRPFGIAVLKSNAAIRRPVETCRRFAGHVTIVCTVTIGFDFARITCHTGRIHSCGRCDVTVVGATQIVDNTVIVVGIVKADDTADTAVRLTGRGRQVPAVHAVGHGHGRIFENEQTDHTAHAAVFRFDRRIVGATGNRHRALGACHDTTNLVAGVTVRCRDCSGVRAVLDRRVTEYFTDKTTGCIPFGINADGRVAVRKCTAVQRLRKRPGFDAAAEIDIAAIQAQVHNGTRHGSEQRPGIGEARIQVIDPVTVAVKGAREGARDLGVGVRIFQRHVGRQTGLCIHVIEFRVEIDIPRQHVGLREIGFIVFRLLLEITELRHVLDLVRIFRGTVTAGKCRCRTGQHLCARGERPVFVCVLDGVRRRARQCNGGHKCHDHTKHEQN